MKILMLTPYLPYPPASGGQIRTLNLLKYLSQNNQITLVSLYKNEKEKKYVSYLSKYCAKVYACKRAEKPWQAKIILKALITAKPLLIVRNFSKEASTLLKKLLSNEKYDVIHAETFYIMPHIPKTSIPILLVEQTIEYQVYQHFVDNLPFFVKFFFLTDVIKLKFWEKFYWTKASVVATVSAADRQTIKKIDSKINPVIVQNGAGDEMFAETNQSNKDKNILLFQGNFAWLQNTEAALYLINKICPKIKSEIPNIDIVIAGQQIKKIQANVNNKCPVKLIDISPDNSESVRKIYKKAKIFIAPIFGPGGTRLKILAAMASGVPVISTIIGVEGLDVADNIHVLIANTPEEFIKQIKRILNDKTLYEKIRTNAYKLVKDKYSWSSITKKLEIVYKNIAHKK